MLKNTLNVNKNIRNQTNIQRSLNLNISAEKAKIKKIFLVIYNLHWTEFLMIPLTILYDEYIDRPKLT